MNCEFVYSPNNSSRYGHSIDGIIIHFTGGGDIEGSVDWLTNKEAWASSHYVISRSGRIVQLVKEERAAWHAGSQTTTPKLNGRTKLNLWTIGIELCNYGNLYEAEADELVHFEGRPFNRTGGLLYTRFRNWTYEFSDLQHLGDFTETPLSVMRSPGKKYPWPGAPTCRWETYPIPQRESLVALVSNILERRPHITREWIAGHEEVDPTRKTDPGPMFDMQQFKDVFFKQAVEPKESSLGPELQTGRRKHDTLPLIDYKGAYEPRKLREGGGIFSKRGI